MRCSSRKFNVNGTNKRNSPKGHFLVQLSEEDIKACKLKSNRNVIITHDTGEIEVVDGEEKSIEINVLARLHKCSEIKEEGTIRLDQTIRAAIGVNKKTDETERHEVSIDKVPKNRNRPISEWLFSFGRQRSIARVLMATFTDMEVNICRIRETTMECIGIENGDKIVIESTTKRIKIRALNLSEQMVRVREEGQKIDTSFYSLKTNPRLSAIKNINKDDDLPWILIDFDARNELEVKIGDPVVIYRSNGYAISKNIQSLTVPLVVMLVGIVEGLDFLVGADKMIFMKGMLYLFGSILIIWFNLLPIRNKFK